MNSGQGFIAGRVVNCFTETAWPLERANGLSQFTFTAV